MGIIVNEFKIESKKINRNYKICLLADIHNTKYSSKRLWSILTEQIKNLAPNIILIAGDIIYSADDIKKSNKEKLNYLLSTLCDVAPVIVVYGNHDLKDGKNFSNAESLKYFEEFEKNNSNFHIINNTSFEYEDIKIYGITPIFEAYYFTFQKNWETYFLEAMLKNDEIRNFNKNKSFNIILTHSPLTIGNLQVFFDKNPAVDLNNLKSLKTFLKSIDLFACGHMHDGLIPKYWQKLGIIKDDSGIMASEGKNIKEATMKKVKLCRGVHKIFNGNLVITGGITKWCQPNPIFGIVDKICAKDITILKLVKK